MPKQQKVFYATLDPTKTRPKDAVIKNVKDFGNASFTIRDENGCLREISLWVNSSGKFGLSIMKDEGEERDLLYCEHGDLFHLDKEHSVSADSNPPKQKVW